MIFAIPFPDVSPDIFRLSIGGFDIAPKWYAAAYIVGILGGWLMARWAVARPGLWPNDTAPMTRTQVEDIMTWVVLAIVGGGRLGYCLFYQPAYYLAHPLEILAVWQGGMSFHGGMIATGVAVIVYAMRHAIPIRSILDLAALCTPLGLGLGRVANFINAELWGRPSTAPWAVIFPGDAAQACTNLGEFCARHPSQLYEAALEGVVLLIVLWAVAFAGGLKARGLICGLFLAGYGAARIFVEHFRQADAQYITPDNPLGHVIGWGDFGLSMGQVLSVPMVAVGLGAAWLSVSAWRRATARA
ncbi:prolipoprotein diacylglyceryl transferase [Jannaschia rubra]|uniref:Phosphatidylglycerol--prolipoprotein diacylglyceryl transferase n=1 Tax=Jannaschia rubra TaxID=282197 RepID=A0A0M6XM33_9RHOB|nr:prolipoprotein diacylglyceryl transferase [Jannaschia rubra]CTQ32206.1 Prolipoprotein diacylglyceryl transferase [Jannaschia rubra]SFG35077.1 Prolipoprotein diacylglyceryl transferase [Jannaschia rubra]